MAQHIHKYRRVDIGRDKEYWVMQCQLAGCTHYTPMASKLSVPILVGKVAVCHGCGDRFQLDRRALRQARPSCKACIQSPKKKELDKAEEFFTKMVKTHLG
jgi:hypothetical protein